MLTPGAHLGRYDIVSPLGAGGMGEICLTEDPKHQRQVAIKVLSPEVAAAVGSERFGRERVSSQGPAEVTSRPASPEPG